MFFDCYNFRFHWANFCHLPCWKRHRTLATPAAEAFNRPRRRFFQPEDDPFDFPLGNKDPMYIHAWMPVVVRKVFERFVGWAVVTEIPINKPMWEYCWVVKAAQLTGSTTCFIFDPLFWKIQVWPKQDLDDGTLPMDDFDEDSAGSWDKGLFDVHQLNYFTLQYVHQNCFFGHVAWKLHLIFFSHFQLEDVQAFSHVLWMFFCGIPTDLVGRSLRWPYARAGLGRETTACRGRCVDLKMVHETMGSYLVL